MGARILVVDDNKNNLELMLYLLRAFGYECDSASSGAEGLDLARTRPYDLVLADILMPGMDGYTFAHRFKSTPALANVPLLAVTALAMAADREKIVKAGFDGCLTKPIDPQRFIGHIERYLSGHAGTAKVHVGSSGGAPTTAHEPSGPLVLAVDDIQSNLDVLRAALAPFGYRIAEARSVREAVDLMERARPDAIVCDLHMPDEGGFVLIERVHTRDDWRSIPFVFLSSTAWQTKDRRRGMELGARKFILRPIEPERLRHEIEELIGGDDSDR